MTRQLKWRPIKSAPSNGESVLIAGKTRWYPHIAVLGIASRHAPDGTWKFWNEPIDREYYLDCKLTHWSPLPDPPK